MTNKLITTPSELLNFLKDLTDNYDNLTKDEYLQRMKDCLGVYEYDKPKDINTVYKRVMNFVNGGFAYLPLAERPLFILPLAERPLFVDVYGLDE